MESIYDYDKRLEGILKRIVESEEISDINKKIILNFKEDCFAQNIGPARIIRYMYCLRDLAKWLKIDFDKAKADNLKKLCAEIEKMKNYSPRTKYEYRATLKKFYKTLRGEENPKEVSWIRLIFKKCNDRLPEGLVNEEDIIKMINASKSARDRAIIMSLYESGCRIGEFLKIKIKDMTFDKPGCVFIVQGKTGGRRVRVISAEPYLLDWINKHPDKNNKEAYLWLENNTTNPLQYDALRKVLRVAVQRAGIKKKANHHSFRHARATYLAGRFTEQQLKAFFGWTRSSDATTVYVHLSGKDVDDALLKCYGIKDEEDKGDITNLKPLICKKCETQNESTNKFCRLCGYPLKEEVATQLIQEETMKKKIDRVMERLVNRPAFKAMLENEIKDMDEADLMD